MKVTVAGGTGLIGGALVPELVRAGHQVTLLVRRPGGSNRFSDLDIEEALFDYKTSGPWKQAIASAEAIVNLAGFPISVRWTSQVKAQIRASRVDLTKALVDAIAEVKSAGDGPRILVNANAVGIYGDGKEEILDENSPPGTDWLAKVGVDWEREANRAADFGLRVVTIRTGIVLAKGGGALPKMMLPFWFYLGGPVGSGKQWFSWIHLTDIATLYRFAIENESVQGPLNGCSPEPVRNKDLARELGTVMGRPSWLPVPGWALRIVMGEMSNIVLMSQRMSTDKTLSFGYVYQFPKLKPALENLFERST